MRHSRVARRKAKSRPQTIAYKLHNCLSPKSAISTELKKGPLLRGPLEFAPCDFCISKIHTNAGILRQYREHCRIAYLYCRSRLGVSFSIRNSQCSPTDLATLDSLENENAGGALVRL
jgi:hypothetical protein